MNYRLIGAICVVVACGGAGFIMTVQYLLKIQTLTDIVAVLNYMENELQYRCTPLPTLCRSAAKQVNGKIGCIFTYMADELEAQVSPNAELCMMNVLEKLDITCSSLNAILLDLSRNLGKFDISGQLRALECARNICSEELKQLQRDKKNRVRSYQTLGLCTGAAIAILFV